MKRNNQTLAGTIGSAFGLLTFVCRSAEKDNGTVRIVNQQHKFNKPFTVPRFSIIIPTFNYAYYSI